MYTRRQTVPPSGGREKRTFLIWLHCKVQTLTQILIGKWSSRNAGSERETFVVHSGSKPITNQPFSLLNTFVLLLIDIVKSKQGWSFKVFRKKITNMTIAHCDPLLILSSRAPVIKVAIAIILEQIFQFLLSLKCVSVLLHCILDVRLSQLAPWLCSSLA